MDETMQAGRAGAPENPATSEAHDILSSASALAHLAGITTPEALDRVADLPLGESLATIQRMRRIAIDLHRTAGAMESAADELRGAVAMRAEEHDRQYKEIAGAEYGPLGYDRSPAVASPRPTLAGGTRA